MKLWRKVFRPINIVHYIKKMKSGTDQIRAFQREKAFLLVLGF